MDNAICPPWHGQRLASGPPGQREAHRHLAPDIAESLRRARRGRGWSFRAAARATGVNAGYLCHLEHGRRVPSIVVAEALIKGYELTGGDAALLRSAALEGVGRDVDPSRREPERWHLT